MKTLAKSIAGLVVVLCLTTGCDLLDYDGMDKDRTEQAPVSGGGDQDPCKRGCE